MTPTPADEIRNAAKTLREHATALNEAQWQADHHPEGTVVHPTGSTHSLFQLHADGPRPSGTPCVTPAVGSWMALMDPAVGMALAKWLESLDGIEFHEGSVMSEELHHALTVARAINAPA